MSKNIQTVVLASLFTFFMVAGALLATTLHPAQDLCQELAVDPMGQSAVETLAYGPGPDPMGLLENDSLMYGPGPDPMGLLENDSFMYGPSVDPMG